MTVPIGFVDAWVRYTLAGDLDPMFTALGYRVDTPPFTQANADALIAEMHAALDGCTTSAYTLDGGFVLVGNDGGDIRYDVTVSRAGALGGSANPQNVATLVRKNTGLGGRRNRGRMFLPGIPEAFTADNGIIAPANVTTLQTAVNLLHSGALFAASNVDAMVLLHSTPPTTPTVINSLDVQNLVATQRRRLRR
jgi:hypothetical protein